MWDDIRLAIRLFRDPRISPALKLAIPVLLLAYLLSPIDLIPDFLLGVGQIDDVGILGFGILVTAMLIKRLAPREIVAQHLMAMGVIGEDRGVDQPRAADESSDTIIDASFRVASAERRSPGSDHGRRPVRGNGS
jgi:uncharacterized membrane protein YkvA (DUF1232 family)